MKTMGDELTPGEILSVSYDHIKMHIIHIMRMIRIADEKHVFCGEMSMDIKFYSACIGEISCFTLPLSNAFI